MPPEYSDQRTLVVNEIFHSIQGESSHVGKPCVFIRLAYCNLRCSYCDTTYAFDDGKEMPLDVILSVTRSYESKTVEVTGGEPLLQPNTLRLLELLCDENYEVLLETSGSVDIGSVDPRVMRIVDFKAPSSGMEGKNLWENIDYLRTGDEVKFVIGNREDYEWAREKIAERSIELRCTVLMSAVFNSLDPRFLVGWILEDRLGVRFQLQMQKYIWDPQMRGV